MIVQCENCSTRFRLADEKVGPQGVRVRCSKCRHGFTVTRAGSAPVEVEASPPPPPPRVPGAAVSASNRVYDSTPVDPEYLALDGHTLPGVAIPHLGAAPLRPPEPPPSPAPLALGPPVAENDGPVLIDDDSIVSTDPDSFVDPFAPHQAVTAPIDVRGDPAAEPPPQEVDDAMTMEQERTAAYALAVDLARRRVEAEVVNVVDDIGLLEPAPTPQAISFEELDPFGAAASASPAGVAAEDPFAAYADAAAAAHPFPAHASAAAAAPLAAHAQLAASAPAPASLSEDLFGDLQPEAPAAPPTPSAAPLIPGPAPLDPTPSPELPSGPKVSVLALIANGSITLAASAVLLVGLAYFVLGDRVVGAVMKEHSQPELPALEGIRVTSMHLVSYPRPDAKSLLVATGTAESQSDRARDDLYVVVRLSNEAGKTVLEATSPLGVALGPRELVRLTDAASVRGAEITRAKETGETSIGAGKELTYTVVFLDPPATARELRPAIELVKGDSFVIPPESKPPEVEAPAKVEEPEEEATPEPAKSKRKRKKRKAKVRRKGATDGDAP